MKDASEIASTILDSPKVAAITAASTTTVGGASLLLQLQGWVSFMASAVGLMLSIVLLITHTISLHKKMQESKEMQRSRTDVQLETEE